MTSQEILDVLIRLRGGRQFRGETEQAAGGLDHVKRKAKETEYASERASFKLGKFRTTLGTVGHSAFTMAGIAGIGGLTEAVHLSVDAFSAQQKASVQTTAVLRSTRGAANVTAKGVDELTKSLSDKSSVDRATVQTALNMMLTFRQVRNEVGKGNDVFNQAGAASMNLARSMHKDPTQAALMLGKALNDPATGLMRLQRVGIQFSAQQAKQIKAWATHGNLLKAQKAILAEVNTEFGHSAEAYAHTLPGSIARFKNSMTELGVSIGTKLAPTMTRLANKAADFVAQMTEGRGAGGRFAKTLKTIWTDVKPLVVLLGKMVGWLVKHPRLLEAAAAAFVAYKVAALLELGIVKASMIGLFGPNMRMAAGAEAQGAGKMLGSGFAAKAGLAAAAGFAGWEIGKWLRAHVPAVRKAGDWLGKTLWDAFHSSSDDKAANKAASSQAATVLKIQRQMGMYGGKKTISRAVGERRIRQLLGATYEGDPSKLYQGTHHLPTGNLPRHHTGRARAIASDRGPRAGASSTASPSGRASERVRFVTVHGRVLAEAVFDEADHARARQ